MTAVAPTPKLDVRTFHEMYEGERAYLLDGDVTLMSPAGHRHAFAVTAMRIALQRFYGDTGFTIRTESPLVTGRHSDPEPDAYVARGPNEDYASRHVEADDVLLVVEVADSSLLADRRDKLPHYAAAGIPVCLFVNLVDNVVEVHRPPLLRRLSREGAGVEVYGDVQRFVLGDSLPAGLLGDVGRNAGPSTFVDDVATLLPRTKR